MGWIRNRVPWAWTCVDETPSLASPTEHEDSAELETQEDYPADREGTGIPMPPLGRIWLLRSPFNGFTVAKLLPSSSPSRRGDVRLGEDVLRNKQHLVDTRRAALRRRFETCATR